MPLPGAIMIRLLGMQAADRHREVRRSCAPLSVGSDGNSCTAASPCASFQAALAMRLAGGEIFVLNSGDYGPVTIDKARASLAKERLLEFSRPAAPPSRSSPAPTLVSRNANNETRASSAPLKRLVNLVVSPGAPPGLPPSERARSRSGRLAVDVEMANQSAAVCLRWRQRWRCLAPQQLVRHALPHELQ
jgi:hypothetical protein